MSMKTCWQNVAGVVRALLRSAPDGAVRAACAALAALTLASAARADSDKLFIDAAEFHSNGDFVRALALAQSAAKAGHVRAAVMAGHILEDGLAGAVNDRDAVYYYGIAAAEDDPDALMRLALLAREGRGELSPADATVYFERASRAGHDGARHAQALHYLDPDSPVYDALAGLTLLRRAAVEGRTDAQRDLGLALLERAGDETDSDIDEALRWLRLAAEAGDIPAAYAAGVTLSSVDPKAADSLLEQAWTAGHPLAASDLGWLRYTRAKTPKQRAAAVELLQAAALAGDPLGRFRFAWALANGEGVAQDLEESYRWLLLADASGLRDSDQLARDPMRLRYWLERRLTDAQIRRIERSIPGAR